ncbi:hypothetical protein BAE44_0026031, partial [Dichanthelium oligosanthes]
VVAEQPDRSVGARNNTMFCLGFNGCQGAHPSALDYFLAVLVVVTAVAAARLLVSAVARCLCGDGAAAHHHDHHHSPSTSDVEEDDVGPWGGAGLAIFGQPVQDVPPPRRNDWEWRSKLVAAARTESTRTTSFTRAH